MIKYFDFEKDVEKIDEDIKLLDVNQKDDEKKINALVFKKKRNTN